MARRVRIDSGPAHRFRLRRIRPLNGYAPPGLIGDRRFLRQRPLGYVPPSLEAYIRAGRW